MNTMLAITCALPDESRLLLYHFGHRGTLGPAPAVLGNIGKREVILFHTGMGEARVRERLGAFLREHRVGFLLSIGYAGGLNPALLKGRLFLSQNFSSPELLYAAQKILGKRAFTGKLATASKTVETPEAKAVLADETGADAVDMETAAIAGFCYRHELPMLSLRVISDTATERLAVPFSVCFDAATEKPKIGALLAYLARHPTKAGGFFRFLSDMGQVRAALTEAAVELAEKI